jgi:uncharacterized protein (DUF302 family)
MMRFLLLVKTLVLLSALPSMASANDELITEPSNHSVAVTVERLKESIRDKGWTILATVDHAAQAAEFGVRIPSRTTIIFVRMDVWVKYLLDAPTVAIELGHRVLVWQDAEGTWVTRNTMAHYQRHTLRRHELKLMPVPSQLFYADYDTIIKASTQ